MSLYDDPEYEVRDGIRRGDVRPLDHGQQRRLESEVRDRMDWYQLDARDALEDEIRTHPREWSGVEYRREQAREEERRHQEWLEQQAESEYREAQAAQAEEEERAAHNAAMAETERIRIEELGEQP